MSHKSTRKGWKKEEMGNQNGNRIIGTWYRQEANGKKRNVQENRKKLEKPTISLRAWRNDWEVSSQCSSITACPIGCSREEHVQPLSKSAQPSGAVARDSGG
jgi:hypothetical protein